MLFFFVNLVIVTFFLNFFEVETCTWYPFAFAIFLIEIFILSLPAFKTFPLTVSLIVVSFAALPTVLFVVGVVTLFCPGNVIGWPDWFGWFGWFICELPLTIINLVYPIRSLYSPSPS